MKAKDYLQQIEKINMLICNKQDEIEQWRVIAEGTKSPVLCERVKSSGCQQKMEDAVIKKHGIEEELRDEIDHLTEARQDIIKIIEQLPAIEYDVLHKIYVGNNEQRKDGSTAIVRKTFYEVADDYRKSYTWATTVHGRALKHVQDILDRKEKGCA